MKKTKTTIHPFPGLRPFEEEEEHLFFGREKSVTELLSRLRMSRFLAVIGTSGSGKSSLIKAGLLPSLYRGFMAEAGSSWRVALFRPGDNPIGNLADVLTKTGLSGEDADRSAIYGKFIETTLRRSNRGLIEIVKQARLPGHENLLIVVDQFEELFRFSKLERSKEDGKQDSAAFIKLLLESCMQTEFPIYVFLTMRSDFLGDCTEFRGLPEAINTSQYLIPRMTREEKRAAIAGPIAVGGAEISPTLLSRLLNDVGDNPDHLPILQHALMRTWDYWEENHREGEPLDFKHYEAIGTMERALSQHAEEAYAELKSEKSRTICEKMFKLLTDKGETGRYVRRPAKVSEICSVTNASEKEVINVINVFRQPGRTFLMPPPGVSLNSDSVIDISHESFMRIWTRLIEWVIEEGKDAELYIALAKSAGLYQRGKVGLWRDPELMIALTWREKRKPNVDWAERYDRSYDRAIEFLETSKKQKEREIREKEKQQRSKIRRNRIFSFIISVITIITIIFFLQAQKSKRIALEQKKIAEDALITAEKAKQDLEKETKKTLKAVKREKEALEGEKEAAEREKGAAEREYKAKLEKIEAEKNELKKTIQKLIADMNKYEANFGQYLAKAKELAVLSIAEAKDNELKALLALTAYDLNSKAYDDLKYDTQKKIIEFEKLKDSNNLDNVPVAKELVERYKTLQEKTKNSRIPAEIFAALRTAYIANEVSKDILYPAESWALAAIGNNNIIFNNREGELLLASLKSNSNDSKLPVINKKEAIRLSKSTMLQASSFAETDDRLFCGSQKGSIFYWDKKNWKESKQLVGHNAKILSMAVSKNKSKLIYSVKNVIYIHDMVDTAKPVITLGEYNFIRTLTVIESKDSGHCILIAADSKGNIFQSALLSEKKEKKPLNADFKPERFGFHAIAYNPTGKMLALANSGGEIHLFSNINYKSLTSNMKIRYHMIDKGHKGIVRALAFSPGGRYLASGGLDGTIMLWDLEGKKADEIRRQSPVFTITGKRKMKILSIVFDPKGEYMIFSDEKNLRICPTNPEAFYKKLRKREKREFHQDEWKFYIGESIKQEDIQEKEKEK